MSKTTLGNSSLRPKLPQKGLSSLGYLRGEKECKPFYNDPKHSFEKLNKLFMKHLKEAQKK